MVTGCNQQSGLLTKRALMTLPTAEPLCTQSRRSGRQGSPPPSNGLARGDHLLTSKVRLRGDSSGKCGKPSPCDAQCRGRASTRLRRRIAEMIVFLASGRSRHTAGATIDITGADYVR